MTDLAHPDLHQRLRALRDLATAGPLPVRRGTNVHVHTDHSFSVFRSASEAAWHGAQAGIEVYGVNDFFTCAGHAEFGQACAVLGLPAVFSLECIAMDRAAESAGVLLNDPGNPGKVYLCGKGVTVPDGAEAGLARIRGFQEQRNRGLIERVDAHVRAVLGVAGPAWQTVASQCPAGNTTERHVARAIVRELWAIAGSSAGEYAGLFTKLVGAAPKPTDADQQNQVRANLLKAGKPCYVPEDPAAFPDVSDLRAMFLALGAVPTYPVLGNPLTDGERDIPALFDRIAAWGFHAVELIPARNTDDRVAAVVGEAARRGWPVTDGTEHNTPAMEPLTTTWGMDERFRPAFRDGALVLLGHQARRRQGLDGYLDASGRPRPGGLAECLAAGRLAMVSEQRPVVAGVAVRGLP